MMEQQQTFLHETFVEVIERYKERREWYLQNQESFQTYSPQIQSTLLYVFNNTILNRILQVIENGQTDEKYFCTFAKRYMDILDEYDYTETDPFLQLADKFITEEFSRNN